MAPRRLTLSLLALVAPLAVVQDVRADRGKGVFTGVVKDAKTGKPVAGVLVVATSHAIQGEESVETDARGLYRLPNLPPGVYNLQFFAMGYDEARRTSVAVGSDARIRVDARLQRSEGAADTRVITVPAPTIDVGSATVGQTIDQDFARRVPIAQPSGRGAANRSFESVAEATPTAANDTYGTSVAGSTSPENNYSIDGMNVGDSGFGVVGTPLTTEFIKEVRVDAGGYMPEYGRATGAVINAVTKSGSNQFHGGVWAFYTPGQLQGDRKVAFREGTTVVTEPKLRWIGDAGFDIGGPIVKDRLWFYAGFSAARTVHDVRRSLHRRLVDPATGEVLIDDATQTERTESIPGTDETRRAQATQLQALAKLDLRASKNHRLSVTGIVAPTLSGGNGTYGIDPMTGRPEGLTVAGDYQAVAHRQNSIAGDVIGTWNASTNDKAWLFDTTVGYHDQRQTYLPTDGTAVGSQRGLGGLSQVIWQRTDPEPHSIGDLVDLSPRAAAACAPIEVANPMDPSVVNRTVTCPVQEYWTGGPGYVFDRRYKRVRARHMVTFFGRGAGHHEVKLGVDGEFLQYTNNRGFTGRRILWEDVDGASFIDVRQYGLLTGPDDTVVLDKLKWTVRSAIVGVFAQESWAIMDKVTVNVGLRYDAQVVYGGDGRLVMSLPNQIAPRAGVIWDPTQKGRSKLFASYGRFFQSIPLDIADREGSGEPAAASIWSASGCDPRDAAGQRGPCRDPANKVPVGGPTTPDQKDLLFSTGKAPVDPKLKPQSQDEILAGGQYEVFDGARLGVTYQRRWLVRAIEDMSRDEATTYFIGNPGEGIASDFPRARRTYDALIFQFQKSFDRSWMIAASYTASWLRGNIAGLFRPETSQLDPFMNSDFDLISLLPNRTGWLPGDSRHAFKVFSAGEIAVNDRNFVLLGGAFRATSGGPTSYLGAHYIYGSDEAFILPRGAGQRLPWVTSLDTSLGYRFACTKDLSLAFTIDVFNVLNLQAATAVDNRYTNANVNPIAGGTTADLANLRDTDGNPVVVNPNFGRPTAFQTPRQFRFGLRLTF